MPNKPTRLYQNNKPGLRRHLKTHEMKRKELIIMVPDVVEVKRVQARHRKDIKEAKSLHKEKIEKQFSNGNLKDTNQTKYNTGKQLMFLSLTGILRHLQQIEFKLMNSTLALTNMT